MAGPLDGWNPAGGQAAGTAPEASALGSWKPPAAAATSAALPVAPKASGGAKKGGGGVLGFLGGAVKTAVKDVANVPKGVGGLIHDVGLAGARGTENLANDVAYGATLGRVGGAQNTHLGGLVETPNYSVHTGKVGLGINSLAPHLSDVAARVKASYPALEATRASIKNTGVHAQGAAELPDVLANKVAGAKLPSAAAHKLMADYRADPFGAAVGDAANITMLGGIPATQLAGTPVGEALARGLEPLHAVAGAPLKPWGFVTSGATSALGDLAERSGLRSAVENGRASQLLGSLRTEGSVRAADAARENATTFKGIKASPDEFAAAVLRNQGHAPLLDALQGHEVAGPVLHDLATSVGAMGEAPSPEALRLATAPTDNVLKAQEALRSVSQARETRELAGFGKAPGRGPLPVEETQLAPMPSQVQRLMEEKGLTEAQAQRDLTAIPAKYRTPIQAAREVGTRLEAEMQAAQESGDHNSAAQLEQVLNEVRPMAELDFWKSQEEQPTHVKGMTAADEKRAATGRSAIGKGRFKDVASSNYRSELGTRYTKVGQSALEQKNLLDAAHNEFLKRLDSSQTVKPADVVGERATEMKGAELNTAMREQGYVSWNPNAKGMTSLSVPEDQVTASTRFLPEPVFKALAKTFADREPQNVVHLALQGLGKGLDLATRGVYRSILAFSPAYLLRRVVGDAALANRAGVTPDEFIPLAQRAYQLVSQHQEPAILSERLNSETTDPTTLNSRLQRIQVLPRTIDRMARTMVFLKNADSGADYESAARMANQAMGDVNAMSAPEREVLNRVLPVYGWAKTVAAAVTKLGADHPAAALWAMHLGALANQDPAAFKTSSLAEQFNPLAIFETGGGAVNPLVRGPVSALSGFNLSTGKDVTMAPNETRTHWALPGRDIPYVLGNALPAGKLFEQSPLSGKSQNVARYQTGAIHLGTKGKPLTPYVAPSKTPLGTFGSYWRQYLGLPAEPTATPVGKIAAAKGKLTKAKTSQTYARRIAALAQQGVR